MSVLNGSGAKPASSFQKRQFAPAMPGSHGQLAYRLWPAVFFAPSKTFCSAVFCAVVRQPLVAAPLQVGTLVVRLNAAWQAMRSLTLPSLAPSSASQLARMLCETSAIAACGNASFGSCPVPAADMNCCVSQASATAAFGRLKPGSAAIRPANWSPKRAAVTIAWRPPLEQPMKYERVGLLA